MKNGVKQEKKLTYSQLEAKIRSSLVFVPKDKYYKGIFFDDKGVKLEVTADCAIVSTAFHRHIFNSFVSSGYSRPYLYLKHFVEIALENDCQVKDSNGNITRSYSKLFKILRAKEDHTEYNFAAYTDWWMFNIFNPLYQVGEDSATEFLAYYNYLHNIACQNVFLKEHKDGLTNLKFVEERDELVKQMMAETTEMEIFRPLSDEEMMKQNIEAIQEQEIQQQMKGSGDGE